MRTRKERQRQIDERELGGTRDHGSVRCINVIGKTNGKGKHGSGFQEIRNVGKMERFNGTMETDEDM